MTNTNRASSLIKYKQLLGNFRSYPLLRPQIKSLIEATLLFRTVNVAAIDNLPDLDHYVHYLDRFLQSYLRVIEILSFTYDRSLRYQLSDLENEFIHLLDVAPDEQLLSRTLDTTHEYFGIIAREIKVKQQLYKKAVRLINSRGAGFLAKPHVRAIVIRFPASVLAQSFTTSVKEFCEYVKMLDKSLKRKTSVKSADLLDQLLVLIKNSEYCAYYYESFDRLSTTRTYLTKDYLATNDSENYVHRINSWYYGLQGVALYQDFGTKASLSGELSCADTLAFARSTKAGASVNVLECGIGNGQFGIDFLNTLTSEADRTYNKTTYNYCDFSDALLAQVSQRPELEVHEGHFTFNRLNFMEFSFPEKIDYCRFHELMDDIPDTRLIYKSSENEYFEFYWRFFIGDAKRAEIGELRRLINAGINAGFNLDMNTVLAKINWEFDLRPIDPVTFPHFAVLDLTCAGKSDLLFVFNVGVLSSLERVIPYLQKNGQINIFDYGFYNNPDSFYQKYAEVSIINRQYGANITNDVNFDALAVWGHQHGFEVDVKAQEDYIRNNSGETVLDPYHFSPFSRSYNRMIRHSVQNPSVFPNCAYSALLVDTDTIFGLKERGVLHPFLLYPQNPGNDIFDTISENNDFYINGVFTNHDDGVYFAKKAWFKETIPDIEKSLTALGFCQDILQQENQDRKYRRLWSILFSQ